jgi:glycerophosphoryl diester phosphodiesterase
MKKIGHRGAKGHVAENTLASFQKAIDLHCDGIELDVHLSLDSEIMVIHDATIDRTTNGTGFVKDSIAAELIRFGIPTLEDVIHLVNEKCFINIEIKEAKATIKVVALLQKFISENQWNYNQFLISSFDWDVLEQVSLLNSNLLIGVITDKSIENALAFAQKINANSINPFHELLDKEKVTLLQRNGFLVFPWTVNEFAEIEKMKSFNVDGIISDFPDRI